MKFTQNEKGLIFRSVSLLLLSSLMVGCFTPYRYFEGDRAKVSLFKQNKDKLAVIEFDERGDYWNPQQYRKAEALIAAKKNPMLVVYVHGWRHDARPNDEDLREFNKFLDQLKQDNVVGVYIGWRGATVNEWSKITFPGAAFSFFRRKKIADNVASVPLANTLWSLASTAREKGGHSILIGHSFGGRIVERVIGPAAVALMAREEQMPYDLTFLINPASESLYARQLKLALQGGWQKGVKKKRPAIVAIVSENDSANGSVWPLAVGLLRLTPYDNTRDRSYDIGVPNHPTERQVSYIYKTLGNDARQFTHQLSRLGDFELNDDKVSSDVPARNFLNSNGDGFSIRLCGNENGRIGRYKLAELPFVRAAHQLESDAYWVVPVPTSILSGHGGEKRENGIFNNAMTDLMAGIAGQFKVTKEKSPVLNQNNPANVIKTGSPE